MIHKAAYAIGADVEAAIAPLYIILFNISRNTSDLWLKQREEISSFSAIRNY